jgi:putative membrane protein
MIPVVTIVAFTLMGIEGIADEIEQPFGTDASDLPLGTTYAASRDETLVDLIIYRYFLL